MKFLSVCSGIEAASVAWNPLDWEAVAFSEIEPFPCSLLSHHYPNTPNWGDMTKFQEWPDVSIDLLCGGTPCQSFSVAGLRKGLDDPRGNLMLTFGAIAAKYRPQWLVWENVPGVLSSENGRDFASFLGLITGQQIEAPADGWGNSGIIAGIDSAYGVAWRVLDAQYFGVAQRRRRVFVVGCLGDWRSAAAVLFERHSLQGHPAPRRQAGQVVTPTIRAGAANGGAGHGARSGDSKDELIVPVARSLRGQPNASNREDSDTYIPVIGTLCVATGQAGAEIGADMAPTLNCNHEAPYAMYQTAHTLRGEGFDASEDGTGRGTPLVPCIAFPERMSGTQCASTENLAPSMGALNPSAVAYTTKLHNTASNQAGKIYEEYTVGLDRNSPPPALLTEFQVRRLTPTECEKLQGFPNTTETIRLEICFDLQKSVASVAIQCRKSQSSALTVDVSESHRIASNVEHHSSTSQVCREPLVALHVRQQSEGGSLELRNAQKLIMSASTAGKQNASPLYMQVESFAAILAQVARTLAPTTPVGRGVSHQNILLSLMEVSGNQSAEISGGVTEECANDATPDASKAKFTISSLGRVTVICDSPIATLLCSVITATSGFIQRGILPETFSVELTTEAGYTDVPHSGKPAADGPRYKSLGNSWAVPCVTWIGQRIQEVEEIRVIATVERAQAAIETVAELEAA